VTARFLETRTHGRYLLECDQDRPRGLLVGFHGYAETAETQMKRLRAAPGAASSVCVSVQALHLFYTKANEVVGSWMTRLGREQAIADNVGYVAAVVAQVKAEFPTADRLVYAGFSQGASMAYRAAARSGHACHGVLALGGDVPPDVADDADARLPPVLAARGLRDEWFTEAKLQRDVDTLRARGVSVRSVVFEGAHEWPDPLFAAAALFLTETGLIA
jgi:predicted esterase